MAPRDSAHPELHPNGRLLVELVAAVNARDRDGIRRRCGEGLSAALSWWLDGHSDLRQELDWIVADDRVVAAWITWQGTHDGPWTLPPSAGARSLEPIEPTGRRWEAGWPAILRVEDGVFVDFRSAPDWFAILLQLGLVEIRD